MVILGSWSRFDAYRPLLNLMKEMSRPLNQVSRLSIALRDLDRDGKDGQRLKKAIQGAPGVVSVYVSSSTEVAYILYDPSQITPAQLYKIVQGEDIQTEEQIHWGTKDNLYSEQ